ncbi:MAG: ATPase P [Verrucomicrobiales bacterium]
MATPTVSERSCDHCGTCFVPATPAERFCCAGCGFVHDLITGEGLDRFYQLKGDERLMPAGAAVLAPASVEWAADGLKAAEAAAANGLARAKFDLQGVTCMGCVWLIEAVFQKFPGAARLMVNAQRGEVTLSWMVGRFDLAAFAGRLAHFGYRMAPWTGRADSLGANGLRLGLAGGLAMNAMAFTLPRYLGMDQTFALSGVFELVAAASATLSLLACGSYFFSRAWGALRAGRLHLDVPIAAGLLAAWIGSVVGWIADHHRLLYFDFVATFIFLMLLGRRLQESSVSRNRARLLRADPLLQSVNVMQPEAVKVSQPVSEITRGQEISLPPSSVVPVNAELLSARASLSLEWINGEAEPRTWEAGAIVPAGAVCLGGEEILVRAREDWSDSLLARLSASSSDRGDDPAARWLDRLLRVYLFVVLALAVAGGTTWWIWAGDWTDALQVFISVLVVSCPCALGVAIPMAHELAVARLRQCGLFVRRADLWGRLRLVRRLVFDKTCTLTLEVPQLTNPNALALLQPAARHALQTLVRESRHPLAASLRQALALQGRVPAPPTSDRAGPPKAVVHELAGLGVHFTDDAGARWSLGRPDWSPVAHHDNLELPSAPVTDGSFDGNYPRTYPDGFDSVLRCDGIPLAGFHFREALRPDAVTELAAFRHRGFEIDILSGDRPEKVATMALALGIPAHRARGRLSPMEKADWINEQAPNALFLGDGANDSLAFDAALVRGTPAIERGLLAEKADFYFLSRGLRPVRELFAVASARRHAVLAAFTFALAYNLSVVAISLAGRMSPLLAAILMPLSSAITLVIVTAQLDPTRKHQATRV